MYSFKSDYSEGAHPKILEALMTTNLEQTDGYSMDPHSKNAARLIRQAIGRPDADIHIVVGGTQANTILIASALRPYQAVISAATGHICVHETGAIEATGHKIIAMPAPDGKLTAALIEQALAAHTDEHMVRPKLVYISQPTELGTLYSRAEIEEIRACCDRYGLYLFADGARLACALASSGTDLTLKDLAWLTDAFYIGGTKNGALFGEALVLCNEALKPDFRYHIKQRGGMLAKGRLLGIQFECLFTDGLYEQIGAHANQMAMKLRDCFVSCGFPMLAESDTNQQFPILPDALVEQVSQEYSFEVQQKFPDGRTAIRFVTSWATKEADIDRFCSWFTQIAQGYC